MRKSGLKDKKVLNYVNGANKSRKISIKKFLLDLATQRSLVTLTGAVWVN